MDIFLYSHHLSAWYGINIVRRNSVSVTNGSERVTIQVCNCETWSWNSEEEIIFFQHDDSIYVVQSGKLSVSIIEKVSARDKTG